MQQKTPSKKLPPVVVISSAIMISSFCVHVGLKRFQVTSRGCKKQLQTKVQVPVAIYRHVTAYQMQVTMMVY